MLVGARWHIFTYSFGGILIIHWWLSQLAVVFRVDRMCRMGIADFQTKPPTPRIHKNHRLYSTQCLSALFKAPRGSFATLKPDDLQKLKQMPGSTAPVMSDGFSFSSHLHLGSWAHRTSWHQRRWNERSPCRQGTGTYHENVVMFVVIDGFCWLLTVRFYLFFGFSYMWFLYKGGMSQCPYWEDLRMIEPLCGDDTWSWKPWLLRPINWAQWFNESLFIRRLKLRHDL